MIPTLAGFDDLTPNDLPALATAGIGGLMALRAIMAVFEARRLCQLVAQATSPTPADSCRQPPAAVLAPCKASAGADHDFADSLAILLAQTHPDYEVIFAVEAADDPAVAIINQAIAAAPRSPGLGRVRLIVAGRATHGGQKVHNLIAALAAVSPRVSVLAFVDSDITLRPDWLVRLIAPLADPAVGVATGFRWYLPIAGGPLSASAVLSVWNALICATLSNPRWAFAWGGSMALRRQAFLEMAVADHWRGSLSDDGGLTRAARAAGRPIVFVPGCLMLSRGDVSWPALWEFVTRQFLIVRVYGLPFWWAGLVITAMYAVTVYVAAPWGLARLTVSPTDSVGWLLTVGGVVCLAAGVAAGVYRHRTALAGFADHAAAVARTMPLLIGGNPLITLLNLAALITSGLSRRMVWRGIHYRLDGPNAVVIEGREP